MLDCANDSAHHGRGIMRALANVCAPSFDKQTHADICLRLQERRRGGKHSTGCRTERHKHANVEGAVPGHGPSLLEDISIFQWNAATRLASGKEGQLDGATSPQLPGLARGTAWILRAGKRRSCPTAPPTEAHALQVSIDPSREVAGPGPPREK